MPATLENTHKKYDKSAVCCDCCCNFCSCIYTRSSAKNGYSYKHAVNDE